MKKMFTFLAGAFLLLFLFVLTGCFSLGFPEAVGENRYHSSEGTDATINLVPISNKSYEEAYDSPLRGEPPRQLWFDGFGEIAELYRILEKSDEMISQYLDANNLSMNGLWNKADVEGLFSTLSKVRLPTLGAVSPFIIIYPDYNLMHFWFEHDNGARYNFAVSLEPDTAADRVDSLLFENRISSEISDLVQAERSRLVYNQTDGTLTLDNVNLLANTITYYSVVASERAIVQGTQIFAMNVNGTFITLRVDDANTADNAIYGLATFEFCSLNNILINSGLLSEMQFGTSETE